LHRAVTVWETVPGHAEVVAQLQAAAVSPVHAYLLVGPPGAGARAAATAFAAALVCEHRGCGECRDCRRALDDEHPDVLRWEPEGAAIAAEDVRAQIVPMAFSSPLEAERRVLVLGEMHRAVVQGPMLLKTIEEPPASTVFVILADVVTPELVTIASRCARIDVPPLPAQVVAATLEAEGADPDAAQAAAAASLGDLDRARILLVDPALGQRREAWWLAPERLDGTGSAVVAVVDELRTRIEEAAGPLKEVQSAEVAELERWIAEHGERGAGRKELVARHRRQARRHRAEELRFGLATLAARYRDALGDGTGPQARAAVDAVRAIDAAAEGLTRNPNESLLLQSLFLSLAPLARR
jgi:DNA polymerase-3 subunit delta'